MSQAQDKYFDFGRDWVDNRPLIQQAYELVAMRQSEGVNSKKLIDEATSSVQESSGEMGIPWLFYRAITVALLEGSQ
ncbi:hypothetical protein F4677DRAFT_450990 [Hypoxylon crocopeplum]|nr:hypothetical protein F4677DRAFT_450990 [Hypoxylon crocopeplum]